MLPKIPKAESAKLKLYQPVFAALGDATRLGLVLQLADGQQRSISELTEHSALSRQAVTKHLQILEQAGIVRGTKVGRESLFEIRPQKLRESAESLERISQQWDETLARLQNFVKKDLEP